jgi:hypothetical protein
MMKMGKCTIVTNVIPENDECKHLSQAKMPDDTLSHASEPLPYVNSDDDESVTLEGSDLPKNLLKHYPFSATESFRHTLQNLQFADFLNTNPQAEWKNLQADSDSDTALIATMYDGKHDPKTYAKALRSHEFKNWWADMCVEFKIMEIKQVWEITPKASIPKGRIIIGSRWVYARKDDGRYRAHCVAKGFSQLPGEDFQENRAPVNTRFKLEAGQFDIEKLRFCMLNLKKTYG